MWILGWNLERKKKQNTSKNQKSHFFKQPKQEEEVRTCTSRSWWSWVAQLDSTSQELPPVLCSSVIRPCLSSAASCVVWILACIHVYFHQSLSNLFLQILLPFPEAGGNDFRPAFSSTPESLRCTRWWPRLPPACQGNSSFPLQRA